MSTPLKLQKMGQVLISPTHPTRTSSSMLVLGMILPIPPLPLRAGMYMQLTVHKIIV